MERAVKLTPQDVAREVELAESRIRPYIRETYLEYSPYYSELSGANVHFKLENLQHTGSFKARGAMSKLRSLAPNELERGVVAASTGNHGAAVAWALGTLGAKGVVFVPENASPDKVKVVGRLGAEVRYHGDDCAVAEARARAYAEENGMVYVSPYNDVQVVGGQGTVAVELQRQLGNFDAVFVSLGGGGLISGIAGYLKSVRPDVHIIGCSPENSKVMIRSVLAGEILDLPSLPTLSDGTAGGVEPGAITFDLCRTLVDEYATVTEDDIAERLREFIRTHHMMIEGSAAVVIASLMKTRERFVDRNVVVVLCGANIAAETLRELL
jgi:threonine dehydratase